MAIGDIPDAVRLQAASIAWNNGVLPQVPPNPNLANKVVAVFPGLLSPPTGASLPPQLRRLAADPVFQQVRGAVLQGFARVPQVLERVVPALARGTGPLLQAGGAGLAIGGAVAQLASPWVSGIPYVGPAASAVLGVGGSIAEAAAPIVTTVGGVVGGVVNAMQNGPGAGNLPQTVQDAISQVQSVGQGAFEAPVPIQM